MKNIYVTQVSQTEPITVKTGYYDDDEFILVSCNHANAEDKDCYPLVSYYDSNGDLNYDTVHEEYLYCPDCKAIYDEQEDIWMPEN